MPTYDYCCDSCGHTFELFQSITAGAKRKCPVCSRHKLRRLIGPGAAIVFKGSGFYQTDYRSESYKKGAEAAKKASGTGDTGSSAKSNDKSNDKSKTAEPPATTSA